MTDVSRIAADAFHTVFDNSDTDVPADLNDNSNIFDLIDSYAVVDLLMETEGRIEDATGRYVPLADETIFDAEKSPLKKWSDWVAYVEKCLGN